MIDLSAKSRARVWAGTLTGTLFCVAIALLVDSSNFPNLTEEGLRRAIMINTMVPTLLAGPLLFLLLSKIRQLAIAHEQMAVLATTDSLTAVLNRGAFHMLVDAYLTQTRSATQASSEGSLLIIDADHFKRINDGLGHQKGDEALQLIAKGIRGGLRGIDLVGRIGGEEFGVFLPGAAEREANVVAERIRRQIEELPFPSADTRTLTVSIGGVSFRNEANFDRLFVIADRCLYEAKNAGRNQVRLMNHVGLIQSPPPSWTH
jgi:diguanylate cyclase (GGDEF)-like protein